MAWHDTTPNERERGKRQTLDNEGRQNDGGEGTELRQRCGALLIVSFFILAAFFAPRGAKAFEDYKYKQ